jgi:hypothetical protein
MASRQASFNWGNPLDDDGAVAAENVSIHGSSIACADARALLLHRVFDNGVRAGQKCVGRRRKLLPFVYVGMRACIRPDDAHEDEDGCMLLLIR